MLSKESAQPEIASLDNLRQTREDNPLLRLSKLTATMIDKALGDPVIHTALLVLATVGTLCVENYVERTFFGPKITTVGSPLPSEAEIKQAEAIKHLVRANVAGDTGIVVVSARAVGYVSKRGLATRTLPNDEDPTNLLLYNNRLFPNREPFRYTYLAGLSYPNGDWKIWTVRPDRREPSMSGGWLFSAKEFNVNGEIEQFISDTPLDKLVAEVVNGISY